MATLLSSVSASIATSHQKEARHPYIDEDGEPLMDPDAPSSPPQGMGSPDPYMEGDDDYAEQRDRSPTPVHNFDKGSKPKKRLIKKSTGGRGESDGLMEELNDWDDEVRDDMPSASSAKKKRKKDFDREAR